MSTRCAVARSLARRRSSTRGPTRSRSRTLSGACSLPPSLDAADPFRRVLVEQVLPLRDGILELGHHLFQCRAADSGRGDDQTGERGLYGGDQAKFLKSATLFSSAEIGDA